MGAWFVCPILFGYTVDWCMVNLFHSKSFILLNIYIYMYWVYFCFINQENYNHVSFETLNDLLQCRMYFQAQFVLSCQKEIYLKYGFFFFSFFLLDLFALLSVYHKSFIFLKKHNAVYFISVSSVCSLNLNLEKIIFFFINLNIIIHLIKI